MAQYQPLTEETAVQLVIKLQYFREDATLKVKEIGDGNLNLVFHIVDEENGKSIIVKQALPYAKVVGESWPLTLERARFESSFLQKAAEYVPDLVPKVFHFDETLAIIVMEDLSSHTILRKGTIEGIIYPKLAEHIGTFVAQVTFHTSDFYLHPFEKKQLVKEFINPELCKITEDLVFTDPFFDHETNDFPDGIRDTVEQLWQDQELKREAAKLKFQFLTQAEALLHGDLHTGSIFVTKESTKVIDSEFAYFGPAGFDLGQFFANLVLNYISQEAHIEELEKRKQYQAYLVDTIRETWSHFTKQFTELWHSKGNEVYTKVPGTLESFLNKVWTDAVGFAGCEAIRRTIGLAHVADLDSIQDLDKQYAAKKKALAIGAEFIKKRKQIQSVEQFIELFHVK
ncbi:S-methyl-5-thioribose kinase [Thermoflavimicrobium dichotomicum]|uniref:Methylthioribose kinase n=1 Tax=Thermoflavimicrobium dichotomicum TaxID=46223 RepID=A0A1I3LH24_9BACL|nr:S-methyl-5-thioribose kinase [Thermoflavimicrobium dichotomicum]SFI83860.1 5-methylthioribose kinase [Thermoflavimicrobium dichotomicum]